MKYPDEIPHRYYRTRANDRMVAELLGLCKGMIADGVVNDDEVIALRTWLESHPQVARAFPGREIVERIERVYADGLIDAEERDDLAQMMHDLVGETADRSGDLNQSTALPLDDPAPALFFEGKEFVFTGNFCISRRTCALRVTSRAGRFHDNVRRSTDYLVIGTVASDAWVSAAWGRKILYAMDLKAAGAPIAIISEAHWLEALEYGA